MIPVTVIDRPPDLESESARDVTLWIAAVPPRALETARLLPRWSEFAAAGRLYPTTLAAVRHHRDTHPSDPS
jgi:hypothetical protein